MIGRLVNNELERMWKEGLGIAYCANLKNCPGIVLVGLRKTTKSSVRISGLVAEI
jgi:hypothetical protein